MRKLLSVMAVLIIALLSLSLVSALNSDNLEVTSVRINGDYIDSNGVLQVEEGQTINIRLGLKSVSGAKDVEVDVKIAGCENCNSADLSDETGFFDVQPGNVKYVNLQVTLPTKLEKKEYFLRLRALDGNTEALNWDLSLFIEPKRHAIDVIDIALYPGNTIKAGRTLAAKVLLQNYGDNEEEDVRVSMEIPALGASATPKYVEVETDDHNVNYEDVPEMFLQIPASAAAGDYQVLVTVEYNDFTDTITKTFTIHVTENALFQTSDKLVLAVGPETQTVAAGQTARYGVALTNAGATSKAFVLETITGDWATSTLSDNLVVLEPGKNQVVYVDVTAAKNAVAGAHSISVMVKSGDEVLQTITLNANVVAGSNSGNSTGLRNGLEIALIILVVLLVIIGLIIGFSRLRKDDDEEQTYY